MGKQPPHHLETSQRAELAGLWARSQPVIEAFIWSMVSAPEDREDLLQDVATRAALSFEEYDAERPFTNWAVGIARYRILEYRRSHAKDPRLLSADLLDQVASGIIVSQSESSARSIAMEACIKQLNTRHRALIEMRYSDDMGVAQIAKQMGSKPSTISVVLHKVRVKLAECIELRMKITGRGNQ